MNTPDVSAYVARLEYRIQFFHHGTSESYTPMQWQKA